VLQQASEIEALVANRDSTAVSDTMDADREAILLSQSVVSLHKKPDETASYVAQSSYRQPDSLHVGLAFRMGFMGRRASRHHTDHFMGVDAERQCTPNLRGSIDIDDLRLARSWAIHAA
jgi:hypothetical protein